MTAALIRPNLIARALTLGAAVSAAVALVIAVSGGSSYVLKLEMSNASGLRPGSQVLLGGVAVGSVSSLTLNSHNVVIADLHLNPADVRIGRGVRASIVAANLLGEEYVSLSPGSAAHPLRSGTTVPESATTAPTDLDQVVDVLDGRTRADLAILLEEAGTAVAGRQRDVGAILRQLPLSLSAATRLLSTLVHDNHTLGELITTSDQFIARVNHRSRDLRAVIGAAAGAATTLALRAGQLRQGIAEAPAALSTLRQFLANAGSTATALRPAAAEIARTAGPLSTLLSAVRPFGQAAIPTLKRAAAVAPDLTRLARRATPTIRRALPTVASLEQIARLAKPLSGWLGLSAPDLFDIASGWPAALQYRDGIGHIFNGNIVLNPKIVLDAADSGASPSERCTNLLDVKNSGLLRAINELTTARADQSRGCAVATTKPTTSTGSGKLPPLQLPRPRSGPSTTAPVAPAVGGVVRGVTSTLGGVTKILNGLTNSVGGIVGSVTHAQTTTTGSGSTGSSLGSLLNYLMGN